ncbi:MAG TPA: PilZ domain-containing protein [Phycisphaerae bacterium]|nr:PilZ domain-containing protein [Phycisphaerae bacterium]HRY70848.1 PilZ domain-containing protein [Phycisphaerae bacterium]HSA28555.1 PilZ domain-containing protein [Phycisphaerae bacterium]
MFEAIENGPASKDITDALEFVEDLERNTAEEVRRQRSHTRFQIRTAVTLQPGNSSERNKRQVSGTTADISEGGGKVLLPEPCGVGDIYLLSFNRQELDLPITFARCVRCSLIRENAFEVGFRFFAPVELPAALLA